VPDMLKWLSTCMLGKSLALNYSHQSSQNKDYAMIVIATYTW